MSIYRKNRNSKR